MSARSNERQRRRFSTEATKAAITVVSILVAGLLPASVAAQHQDRTGKEVVESLCISCHGTGANGAPKIGDKKAWEKRAAQGLSSLSQHALNGIRQMPPHGGNPSLSDTEVERAITYMVNQSGGHWNEPISRTAKTADRTGEQIVKAQCAKCHEKGVGGAPKIGDRAAWIPRLKPGLDVVVRSAIQGHGAMPPRGGLANLTDPELRNAVVYMINAGTPSAKAAPAAKAATGQDYKVVEGAAIYFGVVPADAIRRRPKDYPESEFGVPPQGPQQYYVTIALFDVGNGQRITDATVKARVSTATGAGPEKVLEPTTLAASRTFGNYFAMAGGGPYTINVQIRRPGAADAIQAQFEYEHQ